MPLLYGIPAARRQALALDSSTSMGPLFSIGILMALCVLAAFASYFVIRVASNIRPSFLLVAVTTAGALIGLMLTAITCGLVISPAVPWGISPAASWAIILTGATLFGAGGYRVCRWLRRI